ncbi:uncharacterized protein LOC143891091 [Tasmannia lanceolata]|uniref:uncharacterized protein LOC143891091 n=1 Tax=Tasmannia lanceolata TaxID=3420 RepID=UPI0040632385
MEDGVSKNMASFINSGSGGGSVDPEIVEILINQVVSTGKIFGLSFIGTEETKVSCIDRSILKGSGVPMRWDFCSLDAVGASGGILLAPDGNKFEMVEFWVGVFSVSVVLSDIQKKDKLTFFWGLWAGVEGGEEVVLGRTGLCKGKEFTWESGSCKSRIDRFLFCRRWLDLFPGARQIDIEHSISDHCPIILDPQMESRGPSPFRFEIAWLKIPMMMEKLGGWWGECYASGSSDVDWELKLKINVNSAINEEMLEVNKCKEELNSLILHEEITWRQKSRSRWLKEGDKNTAFFHSVASARRRGNWIHSLNINGVWCEENGAIKQEVKGASSIGEFRPISLVGCLYKLLAKILASSVEGVVWYANWIWKKAYDRVEWHYLDDVMGQMGFGGKWRGWMAKCISSPWFSILINGVPFGYFKSSRGLRQGDPLSPFLFVMVAETLNGLIAKGSVAKLIQGFFVGQSEVEVTHLQFADDTSLFCSPEVESVLYLKAIIRWYELISGQRVNFHKSKLYGVNMDHELSLGLAGIMGCKLDHLPSSYLGLPLGFGRPNIASSVSIVKRVERRLDTWK